MTLLRLACLALPLGLAACASGGDFPSLAPRPVEQLSFEEPIKVDPPVAIDPALEARSSAFLAAIRAGDRAFDTAYAAARSLARAAGASGSDSWVQAQEAISRVEVARTASSTALAEFDAWLVEISDQPVNAESWVRIEQDRAAAGALLAEQEQRTNALAGSVSRP